MVRFFHIAGSNLKNNLLPQFLVAVAFLLLTPLLMGIEYLNISNTARVLEMYTALIGIILLTPISLPEQDKDIRELVGTKYTNTTVVTLIRVLEAGCCLVLLIGLVLLVLKQKHCIFPLDRFLFGTLAEAFFLGGMGLCAYAIFDQIAVAYMLPIVYYLINMSGAKYVKDFYLFSMSRGSYREKYYLAAAGLLLISFGISYPYLARRVRTGWSTILSSWAGLKPQKRQNRI